MKKNLLCKIGSFLSLLLVLSFGANAQDCMITGGLDLTANPTTLCSGETTALSMTIPGINTEATNVVWRLDATGEVIANSTSTSHTPINVDCEPKWVTYRATATCINFPDETKTQIVSVLVYPTNTSANPAANINPANLEFDATYSPDGCNVVVSPVCPYILLTETNSGSAAPGETTVLSFPYSYSYPASSGLACLSGVYDLAVTCESVCTANIQGVTASASDIVAGESVTLSANVQGNGDYTVTWSGSNGFSSTGASAIDAPMSTYSGCEPMQVTYTATVDCGGPALSSGTVTVNIYPADYSSLYATSTSADGCMAMVTSTCLNISISDGGVYTAAPGESGSYTFSVSYDYPDGVSGSAATDVSVAYNCPALEALTFDVDSDCNEITGKETIIVTILGGTGPYNITGSFNDDSYGSDSLPALVFDDGQSWMIEVTDANGAIGVINGTVNCSKECKLEGVALLEECNTATGQWSVTVTIPDGEGTGPFTVTTDIDGATVASATDNSFVISGISNGTAYSVSVTDSGDPECSTTESSAVGTCETVDIELLSFEGSVEVDGNLLQWVTATETNNDFFTLERSADGINFAPIATIEGNGTVYSAIAYEFTDKDYLAGANYYRLSQTDYDGSVTICSEVILLERGDVSFVVTNLLPNPTIGELNVVLNTKESNSFVAAVYDITGKMVFTAVMEAEAGFNTFAIDTDNLSSGTYLLTVANGQEVSTQKFVRR